MRRASIPSAALVLAFGLSLLAPPAAAQWGGQAEGAVVTVETVTVFAEPRGDKALGLLVKGDGVAAAPDGARKFRTVDGRVRIEFVQQDGKRRKGRAGWVDADALARKFAYDCGCAQACWPFAESGRDILFNRCFQEAMVQVEVMAAVAAPPVPGKVTVETEFGRRAPSAETSEAPAAGEPVVRTPAAKDGRPGGGGL